MIDRQKEKTQKYSTEKCPVCNGFGHVSYKKITCHACNGKGYIVIDNKTGQPVKRKTDGNKNNIS